MSPVRFALLCLVLSCGHQGVLSDRLTGTWDFTLGDEWSGTLTISTVRQTDSRIFGDATMKHLTDGTLRAGWIEGWYSGSEGVTLAFHAKYNATYEYPAIFFETHNVNCCQLLGYAIGAGLSGPAFTATRR